MLIDWFTVVAQIINFLILVWLLKRFLYQPLLNAIDAREKCIALKITDADEQKAEAEKERNAYQRKNELFEQQRSAHMNRVTEAAKIERAQLLDAARQESDDLRAKLQLGLKEEQRSLKEELSHQVRQEVFAIVRNALFDLAETNLEEHMIDIFLGRLRNLSGTQIAELKLAFMASPSPLLVRTAFKLSAQKCSIIKRVISEVLGQEKQVDFDITPDLISGIEISFNGQKIAWSMADYLDSLAKHVDALLKTSTETESTDPVNRAEDLYKNDN